VRIVSEPTVPTAKGFFMPHVPIDQSAAGAGGAGVGRIDLLDTNAHERCQQPHSLTKVSSRMLPPANEPFRVLQTHTSTRALRHGHSAAGFSGKNLSLMSNRLVGNSIALLTGKPFFLPFQDRAQVWALVAVRTGDGCPYSHVTAQPAFRLLD